VRLTEDERRIAIKARTPGWITRNVLGVDLYDKQRQLLRSGLTNKETSCKSGHSTGKSKTLACLVVEFALIHPGCKVILTAPTHRQLVSILFPEIRRLAQEARVPLAEAMPLESKWHMDSEGRPNWFVLGIATKENDPSKFQGQHAESGHILIGVEEACGVSNTMLNESIPALMTSSGAHLFKIGNPTDAASAFYNDFTAANGVAQFTMSSIDTPNFTAFGIGLDDIVSGAWRDKVGGRPMPRPYLCTPEWVEWFLRRKCGGDVTHPQFLSRVLAQFAEVSSGTLISLAQFDAARARWEANAPRGPGVVDLFSALTHDPLILGVDVARSGRDSTVIAARKGDRVWIVRRVHGLDGNVVASHVRDVQRELGADEVRIDVIGVGASVWDNLSNEPWARQANASSRAENPDRFINCRAEAYWAIREAFVQNRIECDDGDLREQLTATHYEHPKGKFKVEEKEKIRSRIGRSPDEADAVSLTYYKSGPGWLWR
jgi:hypothetical protein